MQQACVKGKLSTAQALLSKGVDTHAQNRKVCLSAHGTIAISRFAVCVVRVRTPEIFVQGFTFLMTAAGRGHLTIVQELLAKSCGADVDAKNNKVRFYSVC